MVRMRSFALTALGLTWLGASLLGCERKAPGPEECARFARTVVSRAAGDPRLMPQLQAQVDAETRQCLTRPYDRELLNCVLVRNNATACLDSFRLRTRRRE